MPVPIHEPVSVVVVFERGRARPILFRWKNKKISIDRISFTWETREGTSRLFHFTAVTAQALYELVFNTSSLTWRLEQMTAEI